MEERNGDEERRSREEVRRREEELRRGEFVLEMWVPEIPAVGRAPR